MILAGIDEAGYGPLLGPLVVGCCAFEVAEEPPDGAEPPAEGAAAAAPCLWKRLKKVLGRHRDKAGRRLHVNDSKLVYSPSTGLKELERSVVAMAAAGGEAPADLNAFLSMVAPEAMGDLVEHPWYVAAAGERFPLEQEPAVVRMFANAVRAESERCGARLAHLRALVLPERQFNRQVHVTRNKSSVSFTLVATHLDHLLRTYGQRGLTIYCDRQGGRERYGHLLRLMFEDWGLAIEREQDGRSEYRLTRAGHGVSVIFCEKGEGECMAVAVASMLAKYVRETLMRRFNAWWRTHLPEVAPTAGYYNDGLRFLKDIEAKRRELNIADADLIRAR